MKKKLIKLLAIVLTVVLGSVGCSQYKNNRSSVTIEEKRKFYPTKPDAAFFSGEI